MAKDFVVYVNYFPFFQTVFISCVIIVIIIILVRPVWQQHYVDYKSLKRSLKSLKHDHRYDEETRVDRFLLALDSELVKVNVFYSQQVKLLDAAVESAVTNFHLDDTPTGAEQETLLQLLEKLNAEVRHNNMNLFIILIFFCENQPRKINKTFFSQIIFYFFIVNSITFIYRIKL